MAIGGAIMLVIGLILAFIVPIVATAIGVSTIDFDEVGRVSPFSSPGQTAVEWTGEADHTFTLLSTTGELDFTVTGPDDESIQVAGESTDITWTDSDVQYFVEGTFVAPTVGTYTIVASGAGTAGVSPESGIEVGALRGILVGLASLLVGLLLTFAGVVFLVIGLVRRSRLI
jgi:hypothetical protein